MLVAIIPPNVVMGESHHRMYKQCTNASRSEQAATPMRGVCAKRCERRRAEGVQWGAVQWGGVPEPSSTRAAARTPRAASPRMADFFRSSSWRARSRVRDRTGGAAPGACSGEGRRCARRTGAGKRRRHARRKRHALLQARGKEGVVRRARKRIAGKQRDINYFCGLPFFLNCFLVYQIKGTCQKMEMMELSYMPRQKINVL